MSEQKPLSVNDVVAFSIEQFAEVAWQKLGLHPDPITGSIEMNLAEAKTAIDVVGFLAEKLESQLDDDDKRRVQGLVADLRINFVQKSGG